jgi:hypothetical protein
MANIAPLDIAILPARADPSPLSLGLESQTQFASGFVREANPQITKVLTYLKDCYDLDILHHETEKVATKQRLWLNEERKTNCAEEGLSDKKSGHSG